MSPGPRYVRGTQPTVLHHRPRDFGRDGTGLTTVQRDTLARVAAGDRNTDMARTLRIDRQAAKNRVLSLCRALGVDTRDEAVDAARDRGILPAPADYGSTS